MAYLNTTRVLVPPGSDLEDYDIVKEIKRGNTSTIYLSTCRRGRLRNRQLVLKKILIKPATPSAARYTALSAEIHQSSHHPNIVSLYSIFSTPSATFHVLECCSSGSLEDLIEPRGTRTLKEDELSGLLKNILDALQYLRKALVVHRNVKPSNVLISGDFAAKLANFSMAVRLGSLTSQHVDSSPLSNPSVFASPETRSGHPHSFPTDMWAVGCIVIYALSGSPPSATTDPLRASIIDCALDYASPEVMSLANDLLQEEPEKRISIEEALGHAYFQVTDSRHPRGRLQHVNPAPMFLRERNPSLHDPLSEIKNQDLRGILSHGKPSDSGRITDPRRVVSDPTTRAKERQLDSEQETNAKPEVLPYPRLKKQRSLDSFSSSDTGLEVDKPRWQKESIEPLPKRRADVLQPSTKGGEAQVNLYPRIQPNASVGSTRPVRFDTQLLVPKTHKTTHGALTVLPSGSLLIDFRESQRRLRQKGSEVFVVTADGAKIEVFHAPHLSTPCCLVQPVHRFDLESLPIDYWKQYNDAGRLIDQIKRKTPKLVYYNTYSKCVLMANGPLGDVELLSWDSPLPSTSGDSQPMIRSHDRLPNVRIRLSRQRKSVEISRHIIGPRGSEWTKKNLDITPSPPYLSKPNLELLHALERSGMQEICHFLEGSDACVSSCEPVAGTSSVFREATWRPSSEGLLEKTPAATTRETRSSLSWGVSPFVFEPRPRHFSQGGSSTAQTDDKSNKGSKAAAHEDRSGRSTSSRHSGVSAQDDNGSDTEFLPGVGWCVRELGMDQGSVYRLLFVDGTRLVVDYPQDLISYTDKNGGIDRYDIRDSAARCELGRQLSAFDEFMAHYDQVKSISRK
ncbi:kinase-like protein [Pluteus cervinus]|uniref:Kinase-like protein n=1 Tax=Pluteus cervinus TaxID=181527 RepID=A0ACD3BAV4_9AGAR|nr:kinase-like protein [Pluteus cervinus]